MSNKSTPAKTQRLTILRRDGVSDATIMAAGAVQADVAREGLPRELVIRLQRCSGFVHLERTP